MHNTHGHNTQGHGTQGHGTQGHGTQGHGTQGHGTQGHGTHTENTAEHNTESKNIDHAEVAKFERLASRWWDPTSEFKPLHDINPLRTNYIDAKARLAGKRVLDVGCGGGLLCEAMAQRGAKVTGIDAGATAIQTAQWHLSVSQLAIDYHCCSAEAWLAKSRLATPTETPVDERYDIVSCLEMLEHVPDPTAVIQACADLCKPDGWLFFSTINRNPKSYLYAIIGAEYVLNLLPRGTHEYAKFIRPSELAADVRAAGLSLVDVTGMTYNPFSKRYRLGDNVDVNYLMAVRKPG